MLLHDVPEPASRPKALRLFGRFELRQLLGKSAAAMVWRAFDPDTEHEVMLTLPRVQPSGTVALDHWLREATLAARLDHPNLAPVLQIGVQDHWPFIATAQGQGMTLGEWVGAHPKPPLMDVAGWLSDALRGLAFAHEAGIAHGDLQLHSLLIDERGKVSVMALGATVDGAQIAENSGRPVWRERVMPLDPGQLLAQRAAAERDVLACGLLLHHLIAGQSPLDQPDTALAMARLTPVGRELVRLPWSTPWPVPQALRAISNRCTASQERLRYLSARTLLGALAGWREAQTQDGGGPLALLLDRVRSEGHLPALPKPESRAADPAEGESQRTDQLAEQMLDDLALSLELLRLLNSAQVRDSQRATSGPVLTLRRIISLIGVNGIRQAANTLREWPGPLSAVHAQTLKATFDRVRLAGRVAQALRPAGYDSQVVYLIAVLQNLGHLMLDYHFADEARQIRQLMLPAPDGRAVDPSGASEQPGLGEAAAAFAVLGVDIESLGSTVARHWGLSADVLQMACRVPTDMPVRKPETDDDVLRLTASAANEAADAFSLLPTARLEPALGIIAQRYNRALEIDMRDLVNALQAAPEPLRSGKSLPAMERGD